MLAEYHRKFVDNDLADIPGWLNKEAAYLTAHLFNAQSEAGVAGPVVEIGVYWGRYLALLYHLAEGDQVLGIDINFNPDLSKVMAKQNLDRLFGPAGRLTLLRADSSKLKPSDLPSGVRFISIDGSHEAPVVEHDLGLAEKTICSGGIVALDDSFNATTPGVPQGMCAFLAKEPDLAPFAQCYNKLFLTTPDWHDQYLSATRDFVSANLWLEACQRTVRRMEQQRHNNFVPRFFGHEILAFG